MATAQEWLRVNLPPPEKSGASGEAYPESGAIPKAMFGQQQQSSLRQHPRRRRRRDAPGPITCSRSSDEILHRSTNVALSPVTGPGATSFSSVASAFDFHHHLGSDPASELLVLKHILTRECLLSRLETVCGQFRKRFQLHPTQETSDSTTTRLGEGGDGIVSLLSSMRNATVAVIEAISVWRKDMTGHPPSAFVWDGDNYLLKITNDLNFLAGVQPLVDTLKMHPARFCRNPLMLPQTLDEQRRDGELCHRGLDAVSPGAGKRRHLYQVAQVLLDEESLESERDALRRESSKSMSALPARDGTSSDLSGQQGFSPSGAMHGTRSCAFASTMRSRGPQASDRSPVSCSSNSFVCKESAVVDKEALRRQQRLATWYEEARSQLVSLSTSPADEEYFLSSRRFWSKAELGDPGSGSGGSSTSSSPAHRRPSGHFRRGGHRSGVNVSPASSRTEGVDLDHRDGMGKLAHSGGERLPDHKQKVALPLRQNNHMKRPRPDGHPTRGLGGDAHRRRGSADDDERGTADIWSRPDRFGGGKSAALSCLTVDDVEQILREVDPSPATVAVSAAVVFLLAPDDQEPVDFLWPQAFEAVALPAEDFLLRLHRASGGTASLAKASFLAPVLQREHLLPGVIEQQGEHAVASLCAWALEELQVWEEFAEWSEMALEPWYETQLLPAREEAPEGDGVSGCEVRLVYKALHTLPHVGGSYVMSLFEGSTEEEEGGLIIRAFDRAKRDTFWLSLPKDKIDSFGGNDIRSPATLTAALTRRLKMKVDVVAGTKRLVLLPVKKVESSSDKKKRSHGGADKTATSSVDSGRAEAEEKGEAGGETGGDISAAEKAVATPRSQPLPSTEDSATAGIECAGQDRSHPRRSYPPPTRGSTVEDLGPLLESHGDGSECSEGDVQHSRSDPSAVRAKGAPAEADDGGVTRSGQGAIEREKSVRSLPSDISSDTTDERRNEPAAQTPEAEEAAGDLFTPPAAPQAESNQNEWCAVAKNAKEEERGVYAGDFSPDAHEGSGMDVQEGDTGVGVEESGSYADDFAVDEDDNGDDENDRRDYNHREGSDKEIITTAQVADGSGHGRAFTEGGTADSTRAISATSKDGAHLCGDVGACTCPESSDGPHSIATGLGSPSEKSCTPRESKTAAVAVPQDAVDPKRPGREPECVGADTGGGSADTEERNAEDEDYGNDNEFLTEDGDQSDRAGVGVGAAQQSNQPDVASVAGEVSAVAEGDPSRHIRNGNDEPRRAVPETASAPRVPDESTVDESGDCHGGEQVGGAQERQAREGGDSNIEHESEPSPGAEAVHHQVKDAPSNPILKPIAVDMLGNVDRGFMREARACKLEDSSGEDSPDEVEASAALEIAAAMVAAATGSALGMIAGRSEGCIAEIKGDAMSCTDMTTAPGVIERGGDSGADAAASRVMADSPPLTTTKPPGDDIAEMPEDYSDDGDAQPSCGDDAGAAEVLSVPGGTALPLEAHLAKGSYDDEGGSDDHVEELSRTTSPGAVAAGTPSLHEQEYGSEESTGGPVGDRIDLGEVAVREDPAVESAQGVTSTAEDADFEEDFEEDFDYSFDGNATEGQSNEEENGVSLDVSEGDEDRPAGGRISGDYGEEGGEHSHENRAIESAVDSGSLLPPNPETKPTTPVAGEPDLNDRDGQHRQETSVRTGQVGLLPPAGGESDEQGNESVEEVAVTAEGTEATAVAATVAASAETAAEEPLDDFGEDFEDDFEDP